MQLESTIICPACDFVSMETMPINSCVVLHICTHCGTMLRPKPGDSCVFCSYGSFSCPPKQEEETG